MKRLLVFSLVILLSACGTSYRDRAEPITSVANFDAQKYAGLWYEVARFPVWFQEGCTNTQAEYVPLEEGVLGVRNACFRDNELSVIEGKARVNGPGRLKVRLGFMPFAGNYWVLWVDEEYRTAVVGTPSGRAGWILNRTPDISEDRLEAAKAVLSFNGYDVSALELTQQEGVE